MALTLDEPKAIGAAGKTLESIMTRAMGKPSDSAVTREALKTNGITIVVIPSPEGVATMPEKQEPPKAPSFAKAEVMSTNPPTNSDSV
jgi:hypothetical protein